MIITITRKKQLVEKKEKRQINNKKGKNKKEKGVRLQEKKGK